MTNIVINEQSDSPESATLLLSNAILGIFDLLAPVNKVTVYESTNKKYVSESTKRFMRERDQAYKCFQLYPSLQSKTKLDDLKRAVKSGILRSQASLKWLKLYRCPNHVALPHRISYDQ